MKSRDNYLDIIKGISILLIMSVHLPQNLQVFKSGLSFMVPSFFVVSGLLIRKKADECNLKGWVKRRCTKILKPYIVFSIVTIVLRSLICVLDGTWKLSAVASLIYQMLSGLGILTLWFLPALLIGEIIFVLAIKCFFRLNLQTLILFGAGVLFFAWRLTVRGILGTPHYDFSKPFSSIAANLAIVLFQGLLGSFFVGIGYFFHPFATKIRSKFSYKNKILLLLISILLQLINVLAFPSLTSDIHYMNISQPVAYITSIFLGLAAVFCFSISIEIIRISKVFSFFGKETLLIMGTHHNLMLTDFCGLLVAGILVNITNNKLIISWIAYLTLIGVETLLIILLHYLKLTKILGCAK